jgi:hypothetical protein
MARRRAMARNQGKKGRPGPYVADAMHGQQCLLHDVVDRRATKTARAGDVGDDRDAAPEQ